MDLLEYGESLRDKGTGLAADAQDRVRPEFGEIVKRYLRMIARRQEFVHQNDLHAVMIERPSHPNSLGSIWRACAHPKHGFLEMTDRTEKCVDPRKHAHRSPLYRSRIFRSSI